MEVSLVVSICRGDYQRQEPVQGYVPQCWRTPSARS